MSGWWTWSVSVLECVKSLKHKSYLHEQLIQLARCTSLARAQCVVVLLAEEVRAEEGVRDESLQDDIEEACLAEVSESAGSCGL